MKLQCENVMVRPGGVHEDFTLGPVNLEIVPGLITGLVGRNGSGKTTLLRILAGRLLPEEGSVHKDKGRVNLVGGPMRDWLLRKPDDLADAVALFEPWFDKAFFRKQMARFGISRENAGIYASSGEQKIYLLLFELARKPDILLLDEPTSGLTPTARHAVLDLLQEYMKDENHSLVFSTHITADLDRIADRIVFLDNGQIRFDDEKEALRERMAMPGEKLPSIAEMMERFS